MKKTFILYSLIIAFTGCASWKKDNNLTTNRGEITIIFKNYPKNNSTLKVGEQSFIKLLCDVEYINDDLVQRYIYFDESKKADTIKIVSQRNLVEVSINFKGIEYVNYLLHNGDSVIVEFINDIPHAKVLNRKYLPNDIDYDYNKRIIINKNDVPAIRKHVMPAISGIKMINKEKIQKYKDSCLLEAKVQIAEELNFSDSLYKNGFISEEIYNYKRKTLLIGVYALKRNGEIYKAESINRLLADTINYINSSDSLIYYNYYRGYLNKKIRIRLKNIPKIVESNSILPDYCTEFDSIAQFKFLSEKARKYFLIEKLRNILDNRSASEIEKYQAKFLEITKDSLVLKDLMSHYKIDLSTQSELLLDGLDRKRINFDSLLKVYHGKVIYVDYWASWCAPCRASMPFAKKIKGRVFREKCCICLLGL